MPLLVRRWSTTAIVCLPRLIVPADAPKAVPLATMITVLKENAVVSAPLPVDLETPIVRAVSVAISPVKIGKPRPRLGPSRLDSGGVRRRRSTVRRHSGEHVPPTQYDFPTCIRWKIGVRLQASPRGRLDRVNWQGA